MKLKDFLDKLVDGMSIYVDIELQTENETICRLGIGSIGFKPYLDSEITKIDMDCDGDDNMYLVVVIDLDESEDKQEWIG